MNKSLILNSPYTPINNNNNNNNMIHIGDIIKTLELPSPEKPWFQNGGNISENSKDMYKMLYEKE